MPVTTTVSATTSTPTTASATTTTRPYAFDQSHQFDLFRVPRLS